MGRATKASQSSRRPKQKKSLGWLQAGAWLGSLCVMIFVGGMGYRIITDPANFAVRKVSVSNELRHIDRGELERVVAEAIDGNFFTVDMKAIRDRVRQLAWVDQLTVRRVWPQTLTMQVTEQVPAARWGSRALVNTRGEVFYPEKGYSETPGVRLIGLFGPDQRAADIVAMYRSAVERLQPTGLVITRFGLNERREWAVEFSNSDLYLALGRENAVERLERFANAYPLLAADPARRPAAVDLRYAQGFAVSWQSEATDAAQLTVKPTGRAGET